MNLVILSGHLIKDVEMSTSKSGIHIAKGVIGVAREFSKEKASDYINFVAFGSIAEYLQKYGKKGCRTEIVGSWNHSSYKGKDDKTIYEDKCIVNNVKVVSKVLNADKPVEEEKRKEDIGDDDLPF